MIALECGNCQVVNEIFKSLRDKDIETTDSDDNNIFHFACMSETSGKVMITLLGEMRTRNNHLTQVMLGKGNTNKDTPIHILARKNTCSNEEFLRINEFINASDMNVLMGNVNSRTETPIHISAKKDQLILWNMQLELKRKLLT